jgi:hypothetical protein
MKTLESAVLMHTLLKKKQSQQVILPLDGTSNRSKYSEHRIGFFWRRLKTYNSTYFFSVKGLFNLIGKTDFSFYSDCYAYKQAIMEIYLMYSTIHLQGRW